MIYIVDNALVILAATLVGLAIGAAYARAVGGPVRIDAGLATLAFVAEFWLAAILAGALILAPPEAPPTVMAIGSAVVIWIGFVAPTLLVTQRFRGLSLGCSLLDVAHWLVIMVGQAGVMHAIGLVRPA